MDPRAHCTLYHTHLVRLGSDSEQLYSCWCEIADTHLKISGQEGESDQGMIEITYGKHIRCGAECTKVTLHDDIDTASAWHASDMDCDDAMLCNRPRESDVQCAPA